MSADNWGKCPQCKKNAETKLEKYEKKLKDAYGRVTQIEYEVLKSETPSGDVEDRTLREDYEIGIDEFGFFFVTYSGSCHVCKFHYEEKYNKQVTK